MLKNVAMNNVDSLGRQKMTTIVHNVGRIGVTVEELTAVAHDNNDSLLLFVLTYL